jgi:hypothetical protein
VKKLVRPHFFLVREMISKTSYLKCRQLTAGLQSAAGLKTFELLVICTNVNFILSLISNPNAMNPNQNFVFANLPSACILPTICIGNYEN